MSYQNPVIDKHNPLYCPDVSPTSYLATLRELLSMPQILRSDDAFFSFARNLDHSFLDDKESYQDQDVCRVHNAHVFRVQKSSSPDPLPPYSPPIWERRFLPPYMPNDKPHNITGRVNPAMKRKRSFNSVTTFSDLEGPTKRERSSDSIHDSSFDISKKGEKLFLSGELDGSFPLNLKHEQVEHHIAETSRYIDESQLLDRIRVLEDELYGPRLGTETPRGLKRFICSLDDILPGVGIKNRFRILEHLGHQEIAEILGNNGHLSAPVLNFLRTSEIISLDLSFSIGDENGLNLAGRDIFSVFSKPNSFVFLSKLIFSGTPIHDFDLIHIHHLPRLAQLALDDTEIGNEAMFLLVPLKRTLRDLNIASNPRIDDNAMHSILSLVNLSFLSIVDTGIEMPGLRILARVIHAEDRNIRIEIPTLCEFYIDNLDSKYMIEPKAPLIVDPEACSALTVAALKSNLSAHAAFNPDIVSTGTKSEIAERLRKILETRQIDIVIRNLLWGV